MIMDKDDRCLLQFRDGKAGQPLRWCYFGGGADDDEDIFDAAVRELREETGIQASKNDFDQIDEYDDGPKHGYRHVLKFRRKISWPDVLLAEGAGCGFFSPAELKSMRERGLLADWMDTLFDRMDRN